jgi:hypothetical protein
MWIEYIYVVQWRNIVFPFHLIFETTKTLYDAVLLGFDAMYTRR